MVYDVPFCGQLGAVGVADAAEEDATGNATVDEDGDINFPEISFGSYVPDSINCTPPKHMLSDFRNVNAMQRFLPRAEHAWAQDW